MTERETNPYIAIACGGTGGHLFPGLAVAGALQQQGCDVALLVSPKEVDQQALKSASGMEIITLPATAMQDRNIVGFVCGAWTSYRMCLRRFRERTPKAVLAMGGFTSAPPVLAGKRLGSAAFLHEANAIPGRANRWLAPRVDEAFVTFSAARRQLATPHVSVTGMPVRSQFVRADASACRMALGFAPDKPLLLITGGSQGARAVNELVLKVLPLLLQQAPGLQFLHLTGSNDSEKVRATYAVHKCRAQVFPFLTEMELALGAATLVVSRAGASSIAELAAMRVPSILVPYPSAADNHQYHNAQTLVEAGGARLMHQKSATAEGLASVIVELLGSPSTRDQMGEALERWFVPDAAEQIARRVLKRIGVTAKLGTERDDFQSRGLRRSSDLRRDQLALNSERKVHTPEFSSVT